MNQFDGLELNIHQGELRAVFPNGVKVCLTLSEDMVDLSDALDNLRSALMTTYAFAKEDQVCR